MIVFCLAMYTMVAVGSFMGAIEVKAHVRYKTRWAPIGYAVFWPVFVGVSIGEQA